MNVDGRIYCDLVADKAKNGGKAAELPWANIHPFRLLCTIFKKLKSMRSPNFDSWRLTE